MSVTSPGLRIARPNSPCTTSTVAPTPKPDCEASKLTGAWLPDGRRLLLTRNGNIEIVDLASRQAATLLDPPARQSIIRFSLTPDGRRLFYILTANESDIALMTLK